jgi:hypothetical protein
MPGAACACTQHTTLVLVRECREQRVPAPSTPHDTHTRAPAWRRRVKGKVQDEAVGVGRVSLQPQRLLPATTRECDCRHTTHQRVQGPTRVCGLSHRRARLCTHSRAHTRRLRTHVACARAHTRTHTHT